jgi:putative ABC transport system substrate-binding protein
MKNFIWLTVILSLAIVFVVHAQESGKVPRIGFLELGSPAAAASQIKAFQQGLRERGYVEGEDLTIEYRYADGKLDLLPELVADLVRLKVDAIVTRSTASIRAAKNASQIIPVVFAAAGAPVEDGLVASLARPGGMSPDWRCCPQSWTEKNSRSSSKLRPKSRAWPFYRQAAAQDGNNE